MKDLFQGVFFCAFTALVFLGGFKSHELFYAYDVVNDTSLRKEIVALINNKTEEIDNSKIASLDQSINNLMSELKDLKNKNDLENKHSNCQTCAEKKILKELSHIHHDTHSLKRDLKTKKTFINKSTVQCNKWGLRNLWSKYCSKKSKESYSVNKFNIPVVSGMCILTKEEFVLSMCPIY